MRAKSVSEICDKEYDLLDWGEEWKAAFGTPESTGLIGVWGNSTNGKTRFMLKMAKELSKLGKVLYVSHEEGEGYTMQLSLRAEGIDASYDRRLRLTTLSYDELTEKLSKRGSERFIIIDSAQAMRLTTRQLHEMVRRFGRRKLFVVVSRAKKEQPEGAVGEAARYDADLKIQVKGYRAISHGREKVNTYYTIWEDGAANFWGLDK